MPRRVAIVGSRDYPDLDAVRAFVNALPADAVVVSGGAKGVDTVAANTALARGLEADVFLPDWSQGRGAGFARNRLIVDAADEVVAFWDGVSKGTAHTIKLAERAKKPVIIIPPRPHADSALDPERRG